VAAGLDPARALEITPRLYVVEMEGAAERQRQARALVWFGAMLPHLKTQIQLDEFAGGRRKAAKPQSPEVLDAMIKGLAAAWGAKVH
jgi:hypothetical protein